VNKVIRDGKVAVLVSPGFGAGWSTWADSDLRERVLFDPLVVEWVEGGKLGDVPVDHFDDAYLYTGGASDLVIEWLPVGTKFVIREYDGSERLETMEDIDWCLA
jgi:hypothetical protein